MRTLYTHTHTHTHSSLHEIPSLPSHLHPLKLWLFQRAATRKTVYDIIYILYLYTPTYTMREMFRKRLPTGQRYDTGRQNDQKGYSSVPSLIFFLIRSTRNGPYYFHEVYYLFFYHHREKTRIISWTFLTLLVYRVYTRIERFFFHPVQFHTHKRNISLGIHA